MLCHKTVNRTSDININALWWISYALTPWLAHSKFIYRREVLVGPEGLYGSSDVWPETLTKEEKHLTLNLQKLYFAFQIFITFSYNQPKRYFIG